MKMVLALQHEQLPKTLHAETPSGHIAWEGSGLSLLQEAQPWPRRAGRLRRAGVSSFGVSGTNAHVIVEEAPVRAVPAPSAAAALVPLLVSARDEEALRAQARRWAAWLAAHPEWRGRMWCARRRCIGRISSGGQRFCRGYRARPAGADGAGRRPSPRRCGGGPVAGAGKVVFVFPGQGSQWPGMGRALLEESPVFREAVAACDAALLLTPAGR